MDSVPMTPLNSLDNVPKPTSSLSSRSTIWSPASLVTTGRARIEAPISHPFQLCAKILRPTDQTSFNQSTEDLHIDDLSTLSNLRFVRVLIRSQDWQTVSNNFVLMGLISQNNKNECQYYGVQCVAMSAAAIIFTEVKHPLEWDKTSLRDIIRAGDYLYGMTPGINPDTKPLILPNQLKPKALLFGLKTHFLIDMDTPIELCGTRTIESITDKLSLFFGNDDRKYAIFTCAGMSRAIMKINEFYYIFEPHPVDEYGQTKLPMWREQSENDPGQAALFEANTSAQLALKLYQIIEMFPNGGTTLENQFTIDPVDYYFINENEDFDNALVNGNYCDSDSGTEPTAHICTLPTDLQPTDAIDNRFSSTPDSSRPSWSPSSSNTIFAPLGGWTSPSIATYSAPPTPLSIVSDDCSPVIPAHIYPNCSTYPKKFNVPCRDAISLLMQKSIGENSNRSLMTIHGNNLLTWNDHEFTFEKCTNKAEHYKCEYYSSQKCKMRVRFEFSTKSWLESNSDFPSEMVQHTCTRDPNKNIKRRAYSMIKDVVSSVDVQPKQVAARMNVVMPRTIVPITTNRGITRFVQRVHSNSLDSFPKFKDLTDLEIPEAYKVSCQDEPFLLHDSGTHLVNGKNWRVLIFATDAFLYLLARARAIFGDGTFKACPYPFTQLYTYHGYEQILSIPLVYCLLTGKSEYTYNYVNGILYNAIWDKFGIQWSPEIFTTDFEMAMIKSIRRLFPYCLLHGCSFHFGQALIRNMNEHHLKELYENVPQFYEKFRVFFSFQYLEPEKVRSAFASLVRDNFFLNYDNLQLSEYQIRNINAFIKYYADTWVGIDWDNNGNFWQKNAKFPVELWNQHSLLLNGDKVTNNVVEGWHSGFNRFINNSHPTMQRFLHGLKLHQNNNEVDINREKLGELTSPKRDMRTVSMFNAVQKYANTNEENKDVFHFLLSLGLMVQTNRDLWNRKIKLVINVN